MDIESWLAGLGPAQYAPAFRDAEIDPDVAQLLGHAVEETETEP